MRGQCVNIVFRVFADRFNCDLDIGAKFHNPFKTSDEQAITKPVPPMIRNWVVGAICVGRTVIFSASRYGGELIKEPQRY